MHESLNMLYYIKTYDQEQLNTAALQRDAIARSWNVLGALNHATVKVVQRKEVKIFCFCTGITSFVMSISLTGNQALELPESASHT
jgi:hypothetical protein